MKAPMDWTENELLELVKLKQEETLQLDFKRAEALENSEKKKTEISKDVSAFANSVGGTIVYGMAESSIEPRYAETLSPIDPTKYSKEWVEQVINSRIQPRVQGILINPIQLRSVQPGLCAYVVCIPQSDTAHQASDRRYYKRFNFESVPMEDYEVRQTMNRASGPGYAAKLIPSQINDRDNSRFFQLSCTVENIGEVAGRDVSAVLFLPRHVICQPDDYKMQVNGVDFSRIPGTWVVSSRDMRPAIDIPPATPCQISFQRELRMAQASSIEPLRVIVRVYDQFGPALTTRFALSVPGLETVSAQEIPAPGVPRAVGISPF